MGRDTYESHSQRHQRVRDAASTFYSEVLPLSGHDRDNMCITVQVGDDPDVCAIFTIDVMDAATSGDATARAVVDAELLRVEKEAHSVEGS